MLHDRDYTLVLDKSGSMALKDQRGGKSRWSAARESTEALAVKCAELDPDGLTVYVFASRFRRYDNVTPEKVAQVFLENDPCGGTDLAAVLQHAFGGYFQRKAAAKGKVRPETILVVTDGEPDDPRAVMRVVVDASRRVETSDELRVSFVQVGNDPRATRFLKVLDEDLTAAGAGLDICSTVTLDDMEDLGLADVLLRAIHG
jgi:uncharacterized protein with von Willebrand factor type A (vWA) domain